jgi:membrane protein YqaA with SNARE-associated domain
MQRGTRGDRAETADGKGQPGDPRPRTGSHGKDPADRKPVRTRVLRWIVRIRRARRPGVAVGGLSFLEATVLPIPLEAVLIPLMQIDRNRMWRYAAAALIGFMPAALLGYAVGAGLLAWLIDPVMGGTADGGAMDGFAGAKDAIRQYGFWAILGAGILPIPFQAATVGAGALGFPLLPFLAATVLSRALRYFGLALLVRLFGNRTERLLRRWRWRVVAVAFVLAAATIALLTVR